ncbi:MAG: hypothetical protein Q9175_006440, partial [Cornicularia normoerica]
LGHGTCAWRKSQFEDGPVLIVGEFWWYLEDLLRLRLSLETLFITGIDLGNMERKMKDVIRSEKTNILTNISGGMRSIIWWSERDSMNILVSALPTAANDHLGQGRQK